MARGTHVKHVAPPPVARLAFSLRPAAANLCQRLALRVAAARGRASLGGREVRLGHDDARDAEPFDAATEQDTGLSRDDAGKRLYFSHFADGAYPMQGWDRALEGALVLTTPYVDDATPVTWAFTVTKTHVNTFRALHGGCAASLVDVLGSAAVAMGDDYECGVAVALDCHYASPAKLGEHLTWTATVAKRGGRLVTVDVKARSAKTDRLVCYGSVTKSLRGLAKANAKAKPPTPGGATS